MASVSAPQLVSVAEYLAGELASQKKHEYLGGVIYAMAGGRNVHNDISGNVFASLHGKLRSKPCRPYNSDTKIRVQLTAHVRFYYPDVSVTCDPNPPEDTFQDNPALIAEVLSRSTRRTDEGEKRDAYLTIPSLDVYLLLDQEQPLVTVYRRNATGGFDREVYQGMETVIPLKEIGTELALAEVYEGVQFSPEPASDDELR